MENPGIDKFEQNLDKYNKYAFWGNIVVIVFCLGAFAWIFCTKHKRQTFVIFSLITILISGILCAYNPFDMLFLQTQDELHKFVIEELAQYNALVHGIGNIFLLWFHWVFALQYLRASLVLAVLLIPRKPSDIDETVDSIDSLGENEMTSFFMKAYNRHKVHSDKRIETINKRIMIAQYGGGPPMFALYIILIKVFEIGNAGNIISFVIGVAIVYIFGRALYQIQKVVDVPSQHKTSLMKEVCKQKMMAVNIIFLNPLFTVAAFVSGTASFFVSQAGGTDNNYVMYSQFCMVSIMNTMVNTVTSSFSVIMLLRISVISDDQNGETKGNKITFAHLAKKKSQYLIKNAARNSYNNESRKAAVYNAHASQMALLYIEDMQPLASALGSSQKRATDTTLDQNIGMLFSKSQDLANELQESGSPFSEYSFLQDPESEDEEIVFRNKVERLVRETTKMLESQKIITTASFKKGHEDVTRRFSEADGSRPISPSLAMTEGSDERTNSYFGGLSRSLVNKSGVHRSEKESNEDFFA